MRTAPNRQRERRMRCRSRASRSARRGSPLQAETASSPAVANASPSKSGIAGSANAFAGTLSSGSAPNWSQRIGAVTTPHAVETATTMGNGARCAAQREDRNHGGERQLESRVVDEIWVPLEQHDRGDQEHVPGIAQPAREPGERRRSDAFAALLRPTTAPATASELAIPTAWIRETLPSASPTQSAPASRCPGARDQFMAGQAPSGRRSGRARSLRSRRVDQPR